MQPSISDLILASADSLADDSVSSAIVPDTAPLQLLKSSDSSDDTMALYCPIIKTARTDKGLMVYGWASAADYVDDQNEIVDSAALREAVEEWKAWRNIRLMHQPDPVGVAPLVEIRTHPETGRDALYLGAHIVDQRAIRLIETGVLKGFSIGGYCIEKVAETVEL
ncbi:MAG TPA: XkdF-like putative serine protease domain-containing protein [Candidatus Binataceae bacterium]|nr:XkdF-like putative serine protease domain-containing protein [Candidatus Binataceae bacterium]